jgi:hypothetical protein
MRFHKAEETKKGRKKCQNKMVSWEIHGWTRSGYIKRSEAKIKIVPNQTEWMTSSNQKQRKKGKGN